MGLHEVCRNPYHHFDRESFLDMIFDLEKEDYFLSGMCLECGKWRIVYFSELRKPDVIYKDFKRR